jgi:hypothetical protein
MPSWASTLLVPQLPLPSRSTGTSPDLTSTGNNPFTSDADSQWQPSPSVDGPSRVPPPSDLLPIVATPDDTPSQLPENVVPPPSSPPPPRATWE